MNSFTATVATRPRATRPARTPPAMSTCDMIQPPKMSPFWFASAGIGMTRSVACLPSGSFSMLQIMQGPAAEWCETRPEDEAGIGEVGIGDDALGHRGLGFVQVRRDQLVDELLVVRVGLAF